MRGEIARKGRTPTSLERFHSGGSPAEFPQELEPSCFIEVKGGTEVAPLQERGMGSLETDRQAIYGE